MSWLFEDPTKLLLVGAIVSVALLVAMFQTGRMLFGGLLGLVLVLMLAGVVVERLVVTEREEIEDTLHHTAKILETNDLDQIVELIAPDAFAMRMQTAMALNQFKINEIKVTDVEPTINRLTQPATASALFYARVNVMDHATNSTHTRMVRFRIDMQRQGERWLLTGYGHDQEPAQGNLDIR